MRYRNILIAGLLVAACASLQHSHAGNGEASEPKGSTVASAYQYDNTFAAFRSTLSVVDSFTTTYVLGTTEFKPGGRQTLMLQGRFSASGQSCTVQIAYVAKVDPAGSSTATTNNTIKYWSTVQTLTGSSTQKEGSYYESNPLFIDTMGAHAVRILLVTTPASGNVSLWAGTE